MQASVVLGNRPRTTEPSIESRLLEEEGQRRAVSLSLRRLMLPPFLLCHTGLINIHRFETLDYGRRDDAGSLRTASRSCVERSAWRRGTSWIGRIMYGPRSVVVVTPETWSEFCCHQADRWRCPKLRQACSLPFCTLALFGRFRWFQFWAL